MYAEVVKAKPIHTSTVLPRCYALLAVTPPPPPLFSGEITVKGSITRPPPRGPLEPVCRTAVLHVYACCKCTRVVFVYMALSEANGLIKRVENSSRTGLGLFR